MSLWTGRQLLLTREETKSLQPRKPPSAGYPPWVSKSWREVCGHATYMAAQSLTLKSVLHLVWCCAVIILKSLIVFEQGDLDFHFEQHFAIKPNLYQMSKYIFWTPDLLRYSEALCGHLLSLRGILGPCCRQRWKVSLPSSRSLLRLKWSDRNTNNTTRWCVPREV